MPSNFCFHVQAQKSLFKVENVNGFFWTAGPPSSCEFANHRAGSQLKMSERQTKAGNKLKMSESQTKAGNQKKFENLKI